MGAFEPRVKNHWILDALSVDYNQIHDQQTKYPKNSDQRVSTIHGSLPFVKQFTISFYAIWAFSRNLYFEHFMPTVGNFSKYFFTFLYGFFSLIFSYGMCLAHEIKFLLKDALQSESDYEDVPCEYKSRDVCFYFDSGFLTSKVQMFFLEMVSFSSFFWRFESKSCANYNSTTHKKYSAYLIRCNAWCP